MNDNINEMKLIFMSRAENEAFARATVAAFCTSLSPTLEELNDVKMAVSEAVTNCIVHAYAGTNGEITVEVKIDGNVLHIKVSDKGAGIANVTDALQPFYTTCPEGERSGMGFTVMETFMDNLEVNSKLGVGTQVAMTKKFYGR